MQKLTERILRRPYEAVILMHPDATEEDMKNLFRRNKGIVENFKGEVKHLDTWGKRNLANPINGLKKAVYFHTTFEAQPDAVAELERTMRINDRVLRFMHTSLHPKTDLVKFVEDFKRALADSAAREREREAKFQARRAANALGAGAPGAGPSAGGRGGFAGGRRGFEEGGFGGGGRRDDFGGNGDDI